MTGYICEYCEKEVDIDEAYILAGYVGLDNLVEKVYDNLSFFCSFKCAANWMQREEFG